jgi:soluble lytic murein transglycosylase
MKHLTVIAIGLLVCAYQNFTYVDWSSVKLTPINEFHRALHAKELLGNDSKLPVLKRTSRKNMKLHQKLHHVIKENLDDKDMESSLLISRAIIQESQKYKLDPFFLIAVIQTESKFDPRVIGSHGEIGLMQVKPDTAEWIVEKYNLEVPKEFDLKDPAVNIRIGAAYMSYLRESFPKKPSRYIAAYNMGPRRVRELTLKKQTPKEYPTRVLDNYRQLYHIVSERAQHQEI